MSEETLTLTELMLHAEQFCSRVEGISKDRNNQEWDELRMKIAQSRSLLAELQTIYDNDQLSIENALVRAHFRHLIMALMWIAFRGRHEISFKVFRMLVRIESGFTYLLIAKGKSDNDTTSI